MRRIKRFNYRFASKFNQLGTIVNIIGLITKMSDRKMLTYYQNYCEDFAKLILDFSMKTLLIHALKAEAKILRQHFPKASRAFARDGVELLNLDKQYDLLKTGVGLSQTRIALQMLPHHESYQMIVQFGVSGSLDESLSIQSIITAHRFSAEDQPVLTLDPPVNQLPKGIDNITFYSSLEVITAEASRKNATIDGATAVDMESYAVAEFCSTYNLDLLTLRCISDRAGDTTSVDFRQHFDQASIKLQSYLLEHIIKPREIIL